MRRLLATLTLIAGVMGASSALADSLHIDPSDPILHMDPIDPATGLPAEIVPGAPWIRPGDDGLWGTEDDLISEVRGDVDLVLRTGSLGASSLIPRSTGILQVEVRPFGRGDPISFTVYPSDGAMDSAAAPDYFEQLPVMVVAFADLDGDGYVGVTGLDGNWEDNVVEQRELIPVGRRYVLASGGIATGEIQINTGGPPLAPARIALTAALYAGPYDNGHFDGLIPKGPAVMTHVPFLPITSASLALPQDGFELRRADPNGRVGIGQLPAFVPDPNDPRIGEAFTLPLDGSVPTIGVVSAHSGPIVRFGLARALDGSMPVLDARPVRPGVGPDGTPMAMQLLSHVTIPDDGEGAGDRFCVVALDELGNVTAPGERTLVSLRTTGNVQIVEPDTDGDPFHEDVRVVDSRGVEIFLDDGGGQFDNESFDTLKIKSYGRISNVQLSLPDPDVDDNGKVDDHDLTEVLACAGMELGDEDFHPDLDLDGNGRVEAADALIVQSYFGTSPEKDQNKRLRERKKEIGKWKISANTKQELDGIRKAKKKAKKRARKAAGKSKKSKAKKKAAKSPYGKCQRK